MLVIAEFGRNWLIGQKCFIRTSQSRARIGKLSVHDHMTHVVEIDILTGNDEIGNLHFNLKIIYHFILIKNTCIFSKLVQFSMKVHHIVKQKFLKIFISVTIK